MADALRGRLHWTRLLVVLALALAALGGLRAAQASAATEIDPTDVPQLDALLAQARTLLDAHLSPGLSIPIEIGWQIDIPASQTTPAITGVREGAYVFAGHKFNVHDYCQIAVAQTKFDGLTAGNTNWEAEIISHEAFHCYEVQLLGVSGFDHAATSEEWLMEGLARWVDVTLFSSDPIGLALATVQKYFNNSTVSLFARTYDAVGFWGHVQDQSGDLWSRIPDVIRAGAGSSEDVVAAATKGLNADDFYDDWGSSAANRPEGGAAWTATSPYPSGHFSAPTHTITAPNAESTVQITLDPYSTNQLEVTMPSPPSGDIETAHIELDGAYGRFGVLDNYTRSELGKMTFCAIGACTLQPPPTPAGACPGGAPPAPPPSLDLTQLPADGLLAVAAAATKVTVKIVYTPISATAAAGGTCPENTGNGGSNGGSGGDPHFTDFHGDLFDFQAVGEYTLLASTSDDLQIQTRQQQIPHTSVGVNTEVAMRDAKATVEIDATGLDKIAVYVNKHKVGGGKHSLKGGGKLDVSGSQATVTWPDGTKVTIENSLNGPSFTKLVACLWVKIAVSHDRLGHLTGLLGNAGTTEQSEFASRGGTVYPASEIVGQSTSLLYGAFGQSWRIPSRKASLFRKTTSANLHGYKLKGAESILAELLGVILKAPAHVQQAAQACGKQQFANGGAQDACELDVAETGNKGFVVADHTLDQQSAQDVAEGTPAPTTVPAPPPPPPPPPPPTPPALPASIALGSGSSQPSIAHDLVSGDTYVAWVADNLKSVYECTILSGASGCNGGAQDLTSSLGGAGATFFTAAVLVSGGKPVVVAEIEGATSAIDPAGYSGISDGDIAWSASSAGGTLSADNAGKLLANTTGSGEMPLAGAVALGTSDIAVAADEYPFGSGFTDFTTLAAAPETTPVIDSALTYGKSLQVTGQQLAAVADGGSNYLAVVVGDDDGNPGGCPGASYASGFAAAVGTPAQLATQAKWSESFTNISCQAFAPALAGGASGIGLLEDEGAGISGAGSDGVYYRPFSTGTMTFSSPVLVSDESSESTGGADALSVSQDSSGGVYASWSDHRGVTISYSANGGSSWTSPFAAGLGGGGDAVIVGVGSANAQLAYVSGDTEELQVVPSADTEFTP